MHFSKAALATLAAHLVNAHPGHSSKQEAAERRDAFGHMKGPRSIAHCSEQIKARGIERRNVLRRSAMMKSIVQKRGLKQRDLETVLATSHLSSEDYDLDTDESILFSDNSSCVLTPETTQGPYYVNGELIRDDMTEDQVGVPLYIDAQVLDTSTCEPVEAVYVEAWHCNATGVYSGVVASGNGDTSDTSNLDATWLRGVALTDSDGIFSVKTIFPGHYTGRATHIHVAVHPSDTAALANGTLFDTTVSHVGQMFFDQDLITEVEATSPYTDNTQELMTNAEDDILAGETSTEGVDPVMEYVLLGDSVEDGILAWLSFGIDASSSYDISAAATYYESGGVASDSSDGGVGGGEGGSDGGDAPTGSGPDGSQPTGGPGGAKCKRGERKLKA